MGKMTNSEKVEKIKKTNDPLASDSNNVNSNSFQTIVGEGMNSNNVNSNSFRTIVGESMNSFSALINDNIIIARYGIFASIALFTAYGISNTPLFFRYRTVSEIPRSCIIGRQRLYCRIIGVHRGDTSASTNANKRITENSIFINVRHLSPIGVVLPASWFKFLMKVNPSKIKHKNNKPEENSNELLKVQIAGILEPPVSRDCTEHFLKLLAKNRTLVSCQLLGRKVPILNSERIEKKDEESTTHADSPNKRQLSSSSSNLSSINNNNHARINAQEIDDSNTLCRDQHQVALCRLKYRPHWQLFSTDVAETLIKAGNVNVASNVLAHSSTNNTKIVDASQRIQDIRNDIEYIDRLSKFEFKAAQKKKGMWSIPEVRKMKKDIIDEVDFQSNANLFQKIWRMIRGE